VSTEKPKLQQEPIEHKTEIVLPVQETPKPTPILEPKKVIEPIKLPSAQFMIEKLSGFLVASDTVRIDSDVVADWETRLGKTFTKVAVETLGGRQVTCKFKAQKEAKGVIGVPDKILQALDCGKGTLVMVRPVTE
jgi:hypothetical protein